MEDKKVGNDIKGKGLELKKWFLDMDAKIEDWKFSVENTKEGIRVELRTVAIIKHSPPKKSNK